MEISPAGAPAEVGRFRPRSFADLLVEATPRFYVTPALIALNVAWFAIMLVLGVSPTSPDINELQRFGANFGPLTFSGEWWRLVSSTFVHIGVLHLALNMWCLWSLGELAERMFGNGTFLLIYVASGLGGSLASLAWHPYVTSAGASGAIFGVAAALGAFVYLGHVSLSGRFLRELRFSLVFFIGLSLLFGAVVPGIDNAGHVGGLVVGLVLGAALHRPLPVAPRSGRRFLVVPLVALGLLATANFARERATSDASLVLADAARLFALGDDDAASVRLEEAVGLKPDSGSIRSDAGLLYLVHGRYDEAVGHLREAAMLEPEEGEHYNRLALALAMEGSGDAALEAIDRALAQSADAPHLLDSLGTVRFYRGELDDAVSAYRRAVDLEPDEGTYHFNLGVALLKRGDDVEGAAAIRDGRRLDPNLDSAPTDVPLL